MAVTAHAADYYVSTGGNDSNPGTQAAPFRTIQKGADVAKAGDTVHVLPGTYLELPRNGNFAGIENQNDGTPSARIRFVSDTRWGAKVTSRNAMLWASLGDYVDIEGFEMDGTGSNIRYGVVLYGTAGRVLYNHIHHIQPQACEGAVGVDTENYDTNIGSEIIGNLIHDNRPAILCNTSGYGIYLGTPNGKVQNNIVYNNSNYGIHLWHAPYGSVVSHNLSFNNGNAGIIFGCGDKPHVQCHNITISNNIILNNQGVYSIREYGNNDASNRVMNNIVTGNAYNNTIKMITGTASGNLIGIDPKLANLAGGDYHLTAGSPAINAGTTACVSSSSCVPTEDFWQGARPFGAGYDIGPHESGSTPGSAPPLIPPTGGATGGAGAGAGGTGAGRTSGGLSNCAR